MIELAYLAAVGYCLVEALSAWLSGTAPPKK